MKCKRIESFCNYKGFVYHAAILRGDSVAKMIRVAFSYLLWPLLLVTCIGLTQLGMLSGYGVLVFNLVYLSLAVTLFFLERAMPHEKSWLRNDGQVLPDLAHTLLNKGLVQILVVTATAMGAAEALAPEGGGIWPTEWPLAAQVLLGLVVAEFGLYWAHRLAHEIPFLWRFHAVHHSVTRLWFFNTGRFHFMDTALSIVLSQPLLFLAGAPKEVFIWVSGITAFIGILTHCNVEMRFGFLNYIFNTPGLHRWHHSMDLREGNKNYGENLILWDLLFGTHFNEPRRPPADIGIKDPMPASFTGQLIQPFSPRKASDGPQVGSSVKVTEAP